MVAPWLHLDDAWVLDVALATVVVNLVEGAPVWLLIVGPPATAKSELVQLFRHVPECEWLPQVSEATFLSGLQRALPGGRRITAREHSLLYRLTDPSLRGDKPPVRVLLIQDLTRQVTERREKREAIFGQLREIYDGRLTKSTGSGDDFLWEGFLGVLGAVTSSYDDVAELHSILGDRFVLYRPVRVDAEAEGLTALERGDAQWREEAAEHVPKLVGRAVDQLAHVTIPPAVRQRLVDLARLTAVGRGGVARDGYTRVIRSNPEAEGPSRVVQQFQRLLQGLCAVRLLVEPTDSELAAVAKVARDTIPAIRLRIVRAIHEEPGRVVDLALRAGLPRTTVEYHVQDLIALGLLRPAQKGPVTMTDQYLELVRRSGFLDPPNHEM
jgi:hypothetical protein